MAQRTSTPNERDPISPTNEYQGTRTGGSSPFYRSDDGASRRTGATAPRSDGLASGELEGSTLGSSSRDGERRTSGQRRILSSSGFLVDSYSVPREKSSRITSHRPRPSEPNTEKRSAPEEDIVVPKRRSRFPWHRHRNITSESIVDNPSSSTVNPQRRQMPTPSPDAPPPRASPEPEGGARPKETPGLDRDSIKIVNLALNLNESRRRTAPGFPTEATRRRPVSVSQPAAGPVDPRASLPRGENGQRFRSYSPVQSDHSSSPMQQVGRSPVLDLLPASAVNTNRTFDFSDGTVARAERARRHFDLFHEYLRLLPLLPPLRAPQIENGPDSSVVSATASIGHRVYNPLQMIRNRRIRYREKCAIDAEAEGWYDVGKVHDWVNSIEHQYDHMTYDSSESISLPRFQHGCRRGSRGGAGEDEMAIGSAPSSLRHVSRTSSVKASRPRMDWKFSPAELLADAAWLEEGANKAKIVDKNGNKLYPDPRDLVSVGTDADMTGSHKWQLSAEMERPARSELSGRACLSSSRRAMTPDLKGAVRGRHRNRLSGYSQDLGRRSTSSSRKPSRWDKMKMRTASVSSDSSAEKRRSVEPKRRTWGHSRKDSERFTTKDAATSSKSRALRANSPAGAISHNEDKTQTAERSSVNTKSSPTYRKTSLSSAGSYNPRTSIEGMDSTAPSSPSHAGYFPSIAVSLSPPLSRSPSPAKKRLRHKITSRHERSKSKQGDRELKEIGDEAMDIEDVSRQATVSPLERGERVSKLEPSPLPDVVCSAYAEGRGTTECQRIDGTRGRKGQHMPESKLRGIFKGPGRIAGFVSNEVSKVGDMILKKDIPPDSRKTSSATDLASDDNDSRLVRRVTDKGPPPRSFMPSLPTFTSPLRQDGRTSSTGAAEWGSPQERASAPKRDDDHNGPKRVTLARSKTLDFHPNVHSGRNGFKNHAIKDFSVPFSLIRPPVTGLAQVRASPGPPAEKRPALSDASCTWSISDRSIQTLKDSGVPGKTEIERTRALLLSSGVKAREITRRANSVRDPPPHWLQSALGPSASKCRVTRINEFDVAAQSLLRRFETTQYSFQQSMHHFTTTSSSPLRSQLKELENLISQSLTPRVRATADDAEDLCVQLNTTSTLAVKSVSDALDKGVRKRRRRLRWLRRTGFVILEWALVGMLWWVWLIVMAFKLVRGISRGALSGVRWILWL